MAGPEAEVDSRISYLLQPCFDQAAQTDTVLFFLEGKFYQAKQVGERLVTLQFFTRQAAVADQYGVAPVKGPSFGPEDIGGEAVNLLRELSPVLLRREDLRLP